MAKTSPGEFIRQVRAETAKVHWPTPQGNRRDRDHGDHHDQRCWRFFFFGVDAGFSTLVKYLLSFLG